ncbi:MAG TPA: hypothetical protein VEL03_21970 [Streptosporangiaceae bacterium]|nr:hypothetical protein [Streptosporangiaceae bacterium]
MLTLVVVGVTVVVATAVVLAAIVLIVVSGIRREERELSMTRKRAPGLDAALTRRILGLYIKKTDPEPGFGPGPDGRVRWYGTLR